MRHSFIAEDFGVRLRPVDLDDAEFIVWLRHLDHARGKVGDSVADVAGQKAWLENYLQREGDYYFIIERLDATPLGTFGIYDIAGGSGECGRFIIRPGVRASIPSTILAGDLAFEKIGLEQLRATAVVGNRAIRSFMAKLGFCEVGVKPGGRNIGGQAVDMVHLVVTPQRWAGCREHVIALATRAEKQIERWREAQAWAENWRENHLQSVK